MRPHPDNAVHEQEILLADDLAYPVSAVQMYATASSAPSPKSPSERGMI